MGGEEEGTHCDKLLATDLGEFAGKIVRGNLLVLRNSIFMVVVCRVWTTNNDHTAIMQLQSSYSDVRHWEELIDIIEKHCGPKYPYCLTALFK
jgi:hypothetical protein